MPYSFCKQGVADTSGVPNREDETIFASQAEFIAATLLEVTGVFDVKTTPVSTMRIEESHHSYGANTFDTHVESIAQGLCQLAMLAPERLATALVTLDKTSGLVAQKQFVQRILGQLGQ